MTRAEAVGAYFRKIQENPDREYAILQNRVTKKFAVVTGSIDVVDVPGDLPPGMAPPWVKNKAAWSAPDDWDFVRHYHPNLVQDPITGALQPIARDSKVGVLYARVPSASGGRGLGDLGAAEAAAQEKAAQICEALEDAEAAVKGGGGSQAREALEVAEAAAKDPRGAQVSETLDWFDPATNRMRTSRFGYNPNDAKPFWVEIISESNTKMKGKFKSREAVAKWVKDRIEGAPQ